MPISAPPYTAWPTSDDVLARLQSTGVNLRASDPAGRIAQIAAAVEQEIFHSTRRQFVADAEPSTRLFDGKGTAELEIDEFAEFVSATVVGYQSNPGYDLADIAPIVEQNKPMTRLVLARGSVPAWQTEAVLYPQYTQFPAGRQNMLISARWGYGPSIPADLWEAACGEIAVRATREALFIPAGRLAKETYGDESRTYSLPSADSTGWHSAFESALSSYKRPQGRRLRNLRGPML